MIWVEAGFVLFVAGLVGYAYARAQWYAKVAKLFGYLADVEATGRFVTADDWIKGWLKHVDSRPKAEAMLRPLLLNDSSSPSEEDSRP